MQWRERANLRGLSAKWLAFLVVLLYDYDACHVYSEHNLDQNMAQHLVYAPSEMSSLVSCCHKAVESVPHSVPVLLLGALGMASHVLNIISNVCTNQVSNQ